MTKTDHLRPLLRIAAALSDPGRVRLLLALRGRELCVCQLVELLQLAGSTVSRHLALLHDAGLVESRKAERWVYYRLPDVAAPTVVREALDWVFDALSGDDRAEADRKALRKILEIDPSTLCQRRGRE